MALTRSAPTRPAHPGSAAGLLALYLVAAAAGVSLGSAAESLLAVLLLLAGTAQLAARRAGRLPRGSRDDS